MLQTAKIQINATPLPSTSKASIQNLVTKQPVMPFLFRVVI